MGEVISMHASGDLSSNQWRAVRVSAAREVSAITNANAQIPFAVQLNDPDADGEPVACHVSGVTKAEVGGSVSAGDHLSIANDGQFIAAPQESSPATADLYVCAVALEDGSANERIDIFFSALGILDSTE